jgi:predicted DCC family thiol-disulfide oxidoreductase YuxK
MTRRANRRATPVSGRLEVYFDRSCPLCTTEMDALAARDAGARLTMVDCSAAGFAVDAPDAPSRDALMRRIHARDETGRWLRGIDVFVAVYRAAGLERTARVLDAPLLRPWLDRLYGHVADHRRLLAALGVHRALGWLLGRTRR